MQGGGSSIVYKEDGKTMIIDSERLTGKYGYDIAIYYNNLKWETPHDKEIISVEKLDRIKENIKTDLKNINIDWVY